MHGFTVEHVIANRKRKPANNEWVVPLRLHAISLEKLAIGDAMLAHIFISVN